ncbi:MAG: DinB family protein [Candidatus Acidiferrales bacterium]
MNKSIAFFILAALATFVTVPALAQKEQPAQAKPATAPAMKPSAGIAAEFLERWNETGKKLVDMAQDIPEEKFDFKPKPEQRTFVEQLLHAAGGNYYFIMAADGKKAPDDSGFPERAKFRTRVQIVAFIQKSYADGAAVIQKYGDKGMTETVKDPFEDQMTTRAALWLIAISHANDHYGQLVVYYRLNGVVPPESRNQR